MSLNCATLASSTDKAYQCQVCCYSHVLVSYLFILSFYFRRDHLENISVDSDSLKS